MITGTRVKMTPHGREDVLEYLPRSEVVDYLKGKTIYNQGEPSTNLYLVVEGMVKVSTIAEGGRETAVDIYLPDQLFGEFALRKSSGQQNQQATAITNSKVMSWTTAAIEELIEKKPRLAVAFMQMLAQREIDLLKRIESFTRYCNAPRLASWLVQFSERLDLKEEQDGSVHMVPLTHELLGQVLGSTRELTTHYMNLYRRQGYLRHSRKGIILYRHALREYLKSLGTQKAGARANTAS